MPSTIVVRHWRQASEEGAVRRHSQFHNPIDQKNPTRPSCISLFDLAITSPMSRLPWLWTPRSHSPGGRPAGQ